MWRVEFRMDLEGRDEFERRKWNVRRVERIMSIRGWERDIIRVVRKRRRM